MTEGKLAAVGADAVPVSSTTDDLAAHPSRFPALYSALVKAVRDTAWIEYTKPERNAGINYEYLSEEDIVKALRVTMSANGLCVIPLRMQLVASETYSASSGGRMVNRIVSASYRLCHESGESVVGQALGEGSDRGDKSINKAMTGAYKYFLRQLAMIAGGLDPDKTSSDQLARAEQVSGNSNRTQTRAPDKKAAPKEESAKVEKKIEDRAKDAIAFVKKQNTHEAILAAAKRAGEVFSGRLLDSVHVACANRATELYIEAIKKAETLEAMDAEKASATACKVGAANLSKIAEAISTRSAELFGSESEDSGEGDAGEDDAEPIDF